jgi:NAD(P)-dependent dehydrogenase (short-subunit alcohol dehydrogenase family)
MPDAVNDPSTPARPTGKTVVVTGGTRRLGRYISEALAEMGFDIVATHSEALLPGSAELAAFKSAIDRHGVRHAVVSADFLKPDPPMMSAICDACPSALYGLVNNAAMFQWDDLDSLEPQSMNDTVSINLMAPMLLTSEFSRRLKKSRSGGIVLFMLDQKIFNPYPDHLTYTVCKAALNMFLTMCAREAGHDVKFYGLAPGLVLPAPGQDLEAFAEAQKSVLLGASPTPDEIQRCVAFLFSGVASSGFVLRVDGGASLVGRDRDFAFFDAKQP